MPAIEGAYAIYVAAIAASLAFFQPDSGMQAGDPASGRVAFSLGANINDSTSAARDGIATLTWRPERDWRLGLKPGLALGLAEDAGFVALELRKDFRWGNVTVTPFIGPALWQAGGGGLDADELLQVRTGFDVAVRLGDRLELSAGTYHISNAQVTTGSADIDVITAGGALRF